MREYSICHGSVWTRAFLALSFPRYPRLLLPSLPPYKFAVIRLKSPSLPQLFPSFPLPPPFVDLLLMHVFNLRFFCCLLYR